MLKDRNTDFTCFVVLGNVRSHVTLTEPFLSSVKVSYTNVKSSEGKTPSNKNHTYIELAQHLTTQSWKGGYISNGRCFTTEAYEFPSLTMTILGITNFLHS